MAAWPAARERLVPSSRENTAGRRQRWGRIDMLPAGDGRRRVAEPRGEHRVLSLRTRSAQPTLRTVRRPRYRLQRRLDRLHRIHQAGLAIGRQLLQEPANLYIPPVVERLEHVAPRLDQSVR